LKSIPGKRWPPGSARRETLDGGDC
jgi:hypothetical protein